METALRHLVERIRVAAADRTPLRIHGGDTKDFLAQTLEGAPLDMRGFHGVASYEPSELVVTARAGTPLVELEALLAERGQCLPFEPPRLAAGGTVGGMVAAGLAGPARASVGAVRDYVLGLTLVNGRGEVLTFGGQVMKNVAGYDVSRLMAGAFGTLGLIAEVSLKVLPHAKAEATLRFECPQDEALRRLHAWGGQPLPLSASSWAHEEGRGVLHVRLRGAVAAVDAACLAMGGERCAPEAARHWDACRDHNAPWFAAMPGERALWRLSLPQTAPVLDIPEVLGAPWIEWHGGQRWYQLNGGDIAGARRLRDAALGMGGHATLFRAGHMGGGGIARRTPLAPPLARIQAELRRAFDPEGIFNPGWLHSAG